MKKTITRYVDKYLYVNYLKRANECLKSAQRELQEGALSSSAICAIHSCISAVDSICVYYLGKRGAGIRHEDAVELMMSIKEVGHEELSAVKAKVIRVLKIKNMAEYEERLVKKNEAEKLCENAAVILRFAASKLPSV
ncbi:MAG TPA: HEPN domain-containing protein [bacterium]|nr:HEPN domain-containing protein [bacterium]